MAKPILDFDRPSMAWYIVQECLRIVIDMEDQPDESLYTNKKLPKDVLDIFVRIAEKRVDANTTKG